MPAFQLDGRLSNPGPFADLRSLYPGLHAALVAWVRARLKFDDRSLNSLIEAKSHEALAAAREKGEAALAQCPALAALLDTVVHEVELAIASAKGDAHTPLQVLLAAARANRAACLGAQAAVEAARADAVDEDVLKAHATRVLNDAARRLDAMAAQAAEADAPYARLQPLVDALRALWGDVDAAMKPIGDRDQRALRAPFDAHQRDTATRLSRDLYAALSRDRASGAWPRPDVVDQGDSAHADGAAAAFVGALARDDAEAAHAVLAPWLQAAWTPQRLREAIASDVAATLACYDGLTHPPAPGAYRVATNDLSYDELASDEPDRLPPEVTSENFVAWHPVEILTDETDEWLTNWGVYCSLFVATVRTQSGEKVGYFCIRE